MSSSKSDPHNDTASVYHDEPTDHVHQQVKIIKKTKHNRKASEANIGNVAEKIDSVSASSAEDSVSADTMSKPATVTAAGSTDNIATSDATNTCDCVSGNVMYTVAGMFGLAGLSGLFLLTLLNGEDRKFLMVSIFDVLLSSAGLPLLTVYTVSQHGPVLCLIILILAMLLGLSIVYREITNKPVPKWLIGLHIALSFIGFGLLLFFVIAH